jgi:hypothetical protein
LQFLVLELSDYNCFQLLVDKKLGLIRGSEATKEPGSGSFNVDPENTETNILCTFQTCDLFCFAEDGNTFEP